MNFDRNRGIGAACLFLLALLTLSSCGGKQSTSQTTTSPTETTSPSATASTSTADNTSPSETPDSAVPSATASTKATTSPSPLASTSEGSSPDESTSPKTSTTTADDSTSPKTSTTTATKVKPQGTHCPEDAPIKGKIGKRGKIYHLPSTSNYNAIKPNACFSSVAAAEEAGFRAPSRRQSRGSRGSRGREENR